MHNTTFVNYQAAFYGCAWCVAWRGGYEIELWNVTMVNVEDVAHFKNGVGGILIDGDGSVTGFPGGSIAPPTGQFRANSNCTVSPTARYTVCSDVVRRVNVGVNKWTSPWWDTNIMKHYPLIIVADITEQDLSEDWSDWNRDKPESTRSCGLGALCGVQHYGAALGAEACFEQAPKNKYSFMALVGRKYLVSFVDQNFIRATADVEMSVTKMRADEVILFQFTHRPPLYPRLPIRAAVTQGSVELWGELKPQFGAWSPPVILPDYRLVDHISGDELSEPCAAGVVETMAFPGSCDHGAYGNGLEAPQLADEPSLRTLRVVNSTRYGAGGTGAFKGLSWPLKLEATGRTDNGGFLHPMSGSLQWRGGATIAAGGVSSSMYRAYCAAATTEPSVVEGVVVGAEMEIMECLASEDAKGPTGTNLQRFKFGYDWTGVRERLL